MMAANAGGNAVHSSTRMKTSHTWLASQTGVMDSSMSARGAALVILVGLVVGALGLAAADLYTVGVLILFIGGVGAAVLAGEYLIRHFSRRRVSR